MIPATLAAKRRVDSAESVAQPVTNVASCCPSLKPIVSVCKGCRSVICISIVPPFAIEKSLEAMVAEGVESVFARHHEIASHTRDGARSLGLELVPEERYASDTVTAIRLPAEIDGKEFLAKVRRDFDVILGGGQKSLTGKIFRIGHMGWVETPHIDEALEAAGRTLRAMQG